MLVLVHPLSRRIAQYSLASLAMDNYRRQEQSELQPQGSHRHGMRLICTPCSTRSYNCQTMSSLVHGPYTGYWRVSVQPSGNLTVPGVASNFDISSNVWLLGLEEAGKGGWRIFEKRYISGKIIWCLACVVVFDDTRCFLYSTCLSYGSLECLQTIASLFLRLRLHSEFSILHIGPKLLRTCCSDTCEA